MWLCRFHSKAGVALALGAALWIAPPAGDAFAALSKVTGKKDLEFGSAAGDADGTVVMDTGDNKSVTGGAFDLGGADRSGQFQLDGKSGDPYSCTLPSQVQLNAGRRQDLSAFQAIQAAINGEPILRPG